MSRDEIKPLFAYPPQEEQFTLDEAADRIADASLTREEARNKLRHYLAARLIHVRQRQDGRTGRTVPNVLEIEDLAVAKLLAVLVQDFGIADREIPALVSVALYQGGGEGKRHVITRVLDATKKGKWFALRIDALRNDQDGRRQLDAYLLDLQLTKQAARKRAPDLLNRSTVTVQLYPILRDLLRLPAGES